MNRFD